MKHGYGNWLLIAADPNLGLAAVLKNEVAEVHPAIATGLKLILQQTSSL